MHPLRPVRHGLPRGPVLRGGRSDSQGVRDEGGRLPTVDAGDDLRLLRQLRERLPHRGAHRKGGPLRGPRLGDEEGPTICSYCGVGCTIVLNVKDDKVVKVTTDRELGMNKGWTCVKGRFGFDYVHSPDRLPRRL